MTEYQLPESYWRSTGPADRPPVKEFTLYTADQMQQAYAAGREAMRQECVKVCEELPGCDDSAACAVMDCSRIIKELK